MKRKHVMIVGISLSLFYFLFPIVGIESGCYIKESESGGLPSGMSGGTTLTSMGIYTMIFLNGGQLEIEMGNKICNWHISTYK